MFKADAAIRIMLPLAIVAATFAVPAQAQLGPSFQFLEAVRKKQEQKILDMAKERPELINTRDQTTEETALHILTNQRNLRWMAFLIGQGANVNARDRRGITPLVLACNLNFVEGVQLLVDQRARVDEPNDAGETPLISAVHNRNLTLMRILLKAGANPDRADNSGRSARDYARLDGGGQLLAEIESAAKSGQKKRPQGPVYGPSF